MSLFPQYQYVMRRNYFAKQSLGCMPIRPSSQLLFSILSSIRSSPYEFILLTSSQSLGSQLIIVQLLQFRTQPTSAPISVISSWRRNKKRRELSDSAAHRARRLPDQWTQRPWLQLWRLDEKSLLYMGAKTQKSYCILKNIDNDTKIQTAQTNTRRKGQSSLP